VLELTLRFTQAVDYAGRIHTEYRKGTQVPYLAHLLGVASLVLGETGHVGFPVTEDMAIAALLHDAVEDAGGLPRLRDVEANFGPTVARIVEALSDSFEVDSTRKTPWESRKKGYLERLPGQAEDALLVSLADKLYNARAILDDYREVGPEVWNRFKRGRREQLWYFHALVKIFEEKRPNWRMVAELKRTVAELERISSLSG
jgi:(p)ppGpp synthase/HD superfamily hydrolase